jgi:DNA invertase Pin-like site-specific DNA recombinase
MKIFYVRVSTEGQNEERQLLQAKEQNADKIFIDKKSGKDTNRKALNEMLQFAREGDIIIVSDISRIARNTKDLLNIVNDLNNRNIEFKSLKENIDTETPQGQFMLTLFAAMAQLERANILERQKEGIEIAKAEGKYKGRKPNDIDMDKMKDVCRRWRNGEITAVKAQKLLNMSSSSFYRKVTEFNL